jgi:hypothetical protein
MVSKPRFLPPEDVARSMLKIAADSISGGEVPFAGKGYGLNRQIVAYLIDRMSDGKSLHELTETGRPRSRPSDPELYAEWVRRDHHRSDAANKRSLATKYGVKPVSFGRMLRSAHAWAKKYCPPPPPRPSKADCEKAWFANHDFCGEKPPR